MNRAQIYVFFKDINKDPDMVRSNQIKNKLVAILVISITTLSCDTVFVIIGAKDIQLGYILFSVFW